MGTAIGGGSQCPSVMIPLRHLHSRQPTFSHFRLPIPIERIRFGSKSLRETAHDWRPRLAQGAADGGAAR